MAKYKSKPIIDPGHNRRVGRKIEARNLKPFYVVRCGRCGWTCWSTDGEPIPCQQCEGTMEKEKTGA